MIKFDLQRFDKISISSTTVDTVVSGTGDSDNINNRGSIVTIKAGAGDDTISNYGSFVKIYGENGNDKISNFNNGDNVEINGGDGADKIVNMGDNSTIFGGNGNDYISNSGSSVIISGNSGNDTITGGARNLTISGGTGNDIVSLRGGRNIIQYTYGDGADVVYGFSSKYGDTLQITTTKSFSTMKSGSDLAVMFDKGSIILKNTSSANIVTIKGGNSGGDGGDGEDEEKNSWKLDGTTATYGTSSKTLATVRGAKSVSGLSTSGKKVTLKNSALSKKVTVKGSYEFDFASGYKNATISGTDKADTITARGSKLEIVGGNGKDSLKMVGTNQTISGGAGADTFIYAASGGNEKITDFQSVDKLKIGADGTGTYSTATSGDDVIVSTDDGGKITLVGAVGKSLNIEGTKKISGKGVKVNGKKIVLTSSFEDSSFSLSGKYSSAITLDASTALLDLNLTGNKFSNRITGSPQNDTIDGAAGNDTIFGGDGSDSIFGGTGDDELHGGKGKDTLWGGAGDDELYGDDGKDVFYYKTGEGNDTIFGYEATLDKIILASGSISNVTTDRNNNVIFSVGDGQIVVNNAADRTVKIVNSSGKIVDNGLYEP